MYKALIVHEDTKLTEDVHRMVLDQIPDCEIHIANDGRKAISLIESHSFKLIILDHDVPIYSGVQVLNDVGHIPVKLRPKYALLLSNPDIAPGWGKDSGIKNLKYAHYPVDLKVLKAYILAPGARKKKRVPVTDVALMNPFIEASLEVLNVMCNVQAEKEGIIIEKSEVIMGDISCYYPIKGSMFTGTFYISFPKKTFLSVASSMLMEEYTEINEENQDAVSEICNQVFGNAKAHFNEVMGAKLDMATPEIVRGSTHFALQGNTDPRVIVKFNTEHGEFYVDVALKK